MELSGGIWLMAPYLGRDVDWELWINNVMVTEGTVEWSGPFSSDSLTLWEYGTGGASALSATVDVGDEIRLEILKNPSAVAATFVGVELHINGTPTGLADAPSLPSASRLEQNRPESFQPGHDHTIRPARKRTRADPPVRALTFTV